MLYVVYLILSAAERFILFFLKSDNVSVFCYCSIEQVYSKGRTSTCKLEQYNQFHFLFPKWEFVQLLGARTAIIKVQFQSYR